MIVVALAAVVIALAVLICRTIKFSSSSIQSIPVDGRYYIHYWGIHYWGNLVMTVEQKNVYNFVHQALPIKMIIMINMC